MDNRIEINHGNYLKAVKKVVSAWLPYSSMLCFNSNKSLTEIERIKNEQDMMIFATIGKDRINKTIPCQKFHKNKVKIHELYTKSVRSKIWFILGFA
jgi:hypothetical protein